MRGRGFSGGIGSGKRRGRAKTPRSPSRAAPDPGPPRCHHPQSLEAPGQARGGLELEGGETLWTVDPLPQHRATLAIRSGRIRRSGWKVIGGAEGELHQNPNPLAGLNFQMCVSEFVAPHCRTMQENRPAVNLIVTSNE